MNKPSYKYVIVFTNTCTKELTGIQIALEKPLGDIFFRSLMGLDRQNNGTVLETFALHATASMGT